MSDSTLMILYDDVSWRDSGDAWSDSLDNLSLVKRFLGFASENRTLRDCVFVPVSKYLDDPTEYRQYLKVSGLAFRFYGAKGRVFGDERKERDAFWNYHSIKPKSWREQDAYTAYCRKEEKAALESVEITRKALERWTQLNDVPGPRGDRPDSLIVHVCAIVYIDGFTDIVDRGDILRAETVASDNARDVYRNTTWASDPSPVKAKHMGFIVGTVRTAGDAQLMSQYNQDQAKLLVTDYKRVVLHDDPLVTANDSATALQQMISVGLVDANPYGDDLRQIAEPRQGDDTPWNKFIGKGQYDPRLFLQIWQYVYSPSAAAPDPVPDPPKRK